MSDTETEAPRDEAGRFTSGELYGVQGVEADAGYISRSVAFEKVDTPESVGSDEASLRELARKKWGDRNDDPIKIGVVHADTGEPAPENLAQTVEQAASDLSNLHQWQKQELEAEGLLKIAEEVDAKRAEKIKGDPKLAEHYGIEDAKAAEAKAAEKAITPDVQAMINTGVEKDVAIALAKPQVRQAIEQEFARVDQAREQYSTGLENARIASLATLAEVVPHLAGLDPARFEEGLAVLQQVDPPAFQRAMNILGTTNQIVQEQQRAKQQAQQQEYQQFEQSVRSEDARLVTMVGSEKAASAANQALVDYLTEHGVKPDQRLNLVMQNPVLRTAEARQTIWEAAKYREMLKAPAKAAPKPVPAVQKPGVARNAGDRDASEIMDLRQKAAKSGSTEDAFKLYTARKNARK